MVLSQNNAGLKRLYCSALSSGYAKKFKESRDKGDKFGTFFTDKKDGSFSVYYRNIQTIAIEIFEWSIPTYYE